jgi:hypothetical protein
MNFSYPCSQLTARPIPKRISCRQEARWKKFVCIVKIKLELKHNTKPGQTFTLEYVKIDLHA